MESEETLLIAVGRLEGKLDALIFRIGGLEQKVEGITERVAALERYRSWVLGAAAAIGVVAAYGFKLLGV